MDITSSSVVTQESVVTILFFVVFSFLFWFVYKKATIKIVLPPVLPQEGVSIPIFNAYLGGRILNVHNGLWASLTLFDDHFEFRVLTKKVASFGDVKEVSVNSGLLGGSTSIIISFNNGSWSYRGFMNKHNQREVLNYFKSKGCNLSPEALAVLNQAV